MPGYVERRGERPVLEDPLSGVPYGPCQSELDGLPEPGLLVQFHRLDPHLMAAISFADDRVRHHRISARPASVGSRDAPGGGEIVFRATIEVVGQAAASGPMPAVVRDHPPIRTPLPDEEPQ